MNDIKIKAVRGVYISPEVIFSEKEQFCVIEGESFLEETSNFYTPLLDWLNEYVEIHKKITFEIKLTYFNTSTSKWILYFLHTLKKFNESGGKTIINWYYLREDIDMSEEIDDYQIDSELEINKIVIDH